MQKILLGLAAFLMLGPVVWSDETGTPFMTAYPIKETGGNAQIWCFIQDDRGIMYIGDGYGVQEFDGSSWRTVYMPNLSLVRSLEKDEGGRIYVGSIGNFGYLQPDERGTMRFVSLLDNVRPEERSFNYVNSVHATSQGIYFESSERIFRLQPPTSGGLKAKWSVETWPARTSFSRAFWFDSCYYVFQAGIGLMKMVNDSLQLVPGGEAFANDRRCFMLPFKSRPGIYLIGTIGRGLFTWDGKSVQLFATADAPFQNARSYCGAVLADGSFVIGTINMGAFMISPTGKMLLHLDRQSGLENNTVPAVFVDRQGSIWLGVDSALTVVEYGSPLSWITSPSGVGFSSLRRHDGILYMATNDGVYYLDPASGEIKPLTGNFTQDQALTLSEIDGELYTCMIGEMVRIQDKKGSVALAADPNYSSISALLRSRLDGGFCFAAMVNGVALLRYEPQRGRRFSYLKKVPGIHEYISTMAEEVAGTVWCGTMNGGVVRFRYDQHVNDFRVERFGSQHGLPAGATSVWPLLGRVVISTRLGAYTFDETTSRFAPDPFFAVVKMRANKNAEESFVASDRAGNIWACYGSETAEFRRLVDGRWQLQKGTLARVANDPAISIWPDDDGTVWFGTANMVIRYNPATLSVGRVPVSSYIRRVTAGKDFLVDDGGPRAGNTLPQSLPFRLNALRFEYALASYIDTPRNEFRSRLSGFDEEWSDWSRDNKRYYTNLPPGRYRFLVRARNVNGQESAAAEYAFAILAPWYRTPAANIAYGLLALFMVLGFVRLRTCSLQEKSKALEKVVRERTVEIQAQKDNVEQLSVIGRDITDNLSIKDIINTAYENVNTLMDASVFGIGLFNPDKQALVFPATREKGQSLEEFAVPLADDDRLAVWCFKNRKDVVINDYGKEYDKYIKQIKPAAAGENPESILYLPLQHKDKTVGVITAQSFNKNAYTDYHLNILRNLATYSAIALDNADAYHRVNELLNDLKGAQEKLVTQSKLAALGALTAGIAHEIKNPLNFINNFAELTADLIGELRQEIDKNSARLAPDDRAAIQDILATVQDNAGKIKEHGKRADSIVKSMLQHSRGKAGERQSTDINAMLEEDVNLAYHGMRAQDNSFNVTIETEFDPAVGRIEVVPQDISRVFLNIISNACYEANRRKTTAGPGFSPTLTVCSRKLKDGVEVRVRDNGNGIPMAVRDKLFTPFFTTKPTGQGTGLGLSISHDIIVHGHNGQISFESEEGQYTEFIIVLPRQ